MSDDTRDVLARAVAALRDPAVTSFNRSQVAYLLSLAVDAGDWEFAYECGKAAGYRERCEQENAAYPPPPVYASGELARFIDQAEHRRKFNAGEIVPPPPRPVRKVLAYQPVGARSVRSIAGTPTHPGRQWRYPDSEPVAIGEYVHGDDHDCPECAWPAVTEVPA
jgi:hypothetical protein